MWAIRVLSVNGPSFEALDAKPSYVKEYDPDAFDGGGDAAGTHDPSEALQFETAGQALEFYSQVSTKRPLRPDGKPNRPLTACTVEFVNLEAQ